jgi:hypothetical protein
VTDSDRLPQLDLEDWVERFIRDVACDDDQAASHRDMTWNEPVLEVAELLAWYVLGEWDLTQEELAQLWLIGRRLGGRRKELIDDDVLARAAPGRAVLPEDPPGDWLPDLVLLGGGHGPGRRTPGKREFPAGWSDQRSMERAMDVAMHPSGAVDLPSGDFRAFGERDGVLLGVVVSPEGHLLSAYPVAGAGVVQNPPDEEMAPYLDQLRNLVEEVPDPQTEPRVSLDELIDVGEWPHVIESLMAMDVPWTPEQREALADLAELAGVQPPGGSLSRSD